MLRNLLMEEKKMKSENFSNQSTLQVSKTANHLGVQVSAGACRSGGPSKSLPEFYPQKDAVDEQRSHILADHQGEDGYYVAPSFGPLMNSSLNAASKLIIPVDSGFFALMGIKEFSAEMEEIRRGTNPDLEVLGYLLTLVDPTNMASQTWDTLVASFGELVFETKIRRSVKLREAPAFGKTIFHHAPESAGAKDYLSLANEVMARLGIGETSIDLQHRPALSLVAGVAHE